MSNRVDNKMREKYLLLYNLYVVKTILDLKKFKEQIIKKTLLDGYDEQIPEDVIDIILEYSQKDINPTRFSDFFDVEWDFYFRFHLRLHRYKFNHSEKIDIHNPD